MNILNTVEFIKLAHKDQKYGDNTEYWNHCVEVADNINNATENEYIAALLHDVVEDTDYTFEDLSSMGYSSEVVDIVKLLTKEKGSYIFNIMRIVESKNISALRIKISDNEVNLRNLEGLKNKKWSEKLNKKYNESISILKETLHDLEKR